MKDSKLVASTREIPSRFCKGMIGLSCVDEWMPGDLLAVFGPRLFSGVKLVVSWWRGIHGNCRA